MNVEYINPFIEASQSVWTMMTGNKPVLGKVYLKKCRIRAMMLQSLLV